jgi:uncharacterized protein (DUF58 family)
MNLQSNIQLKSRLLPLLVGLLFLLQLSDPSPVWTILLVGLGGAWLTGYIWVMSLKKSLSLRREIRYGWAQVGDLLEERFTIINEGLLPALWTEVIDDSDLPGYEISRVTAASGRSKNQWRTAGLCSQRGVFRLGPTTLKTGDPFSFYRLTLESPASTTLMVMPPVIPLPDVNIASGGRTGEGRPRASALERTVSAAGVRAYSPGDSLHLIHWKTSARQEDLYIRTLDGTPSGDWWIFLDLDQDVQAGDGWDSSEEYGIILTASLADLRLQSGGPVGLASNGQNMVWLPPKEGEGQRWNILRALALVKTGEQSLAGMLQRNQADIGQRSSLVIITPNTSANWVEALLPLMWRGVVPTVLLLEPGSFDHKLDESRRSKRLTETLADLGIKNYVFTREMLDRPEARPGQQGHWEFRVSPQGRAIAVERPADFAWKELV